MKISLVAVRILSLTLILAGTSALAAETPEFRIEKTVPVVAQKRVFTIDAALAKCEAAFKTHDNPVSSVGECTVNLTHSAEGEILVVAGNISTMAGIQVTDDAGRSWYVSPLATPTGYGFQVYTGTKTAITFATVKPLIEKLIAAKFPNREIAVIVHAPAY